MFTWTVSLFLTESWILNLHIIKYWFFYYIRYDKVLMFFHWGLFKLRINELNTFCSLLLLSCTQFWPHLQWMTIQGLFFFNRAAILICTFSGFQNLSRWGHYISVAYQIGDHLFKQTWQITSIYILQMCSFHISPPHPFLLLILRLKQHLLPPFF